MSDDAPAALAPIPGSVPFICNADAAPAYWMADVLWMVLADGRDTGGRFSLMEQLLPKGSGPGPHKHTWSDETFYMLDGEITLLVGDEVRTARKGDFIMVPRDTRHAFRVDSETARFLNGYTPASMEALVIERGTPTNERVLPPKGMGPPPVMNSVMPGRYGMDALPGARTRCAPTGAEPAWGSIHPIDPWPTPKRKQDVAQPTIVIAGAAGDLGTRIAKALIARGAAVRALVRNDASAGDRDRLTGMGATVAPADSADIGSVAAACAGAACVVSALNGLREAIVDRQGVLLDAAVRAGVPRFIPSDYSADFTRTRPGDNRNLDLRREFMARADRAPIRVTSILNGAFMDMLGAEMPIIQPAIRRVLYWGSADQPLDFTTKDDVAAFTAAAALDETTPRVLRIAGDTVSARDIAEAMGEVTGKRHRTLWAGGIGSLGVLIRLARIVAPQPHAAFPPWQGMQYMRDMFSGRGKLHPLDNGRYPGLCWTSVRKQLAAGPTSALQRTG